MNLATMIQNPEVSQVTHSRDLRMSEVPAWSATVKRENKLTQTYNIQNLYHGWQEAKASLCRRKIWWRPVAGELANAAQWNFTEAISKWEKIKTIDKQYVFRHRTAHYVSRAGFIRMLMLTPRRYENWWSLFLNQDDTRERIWDEISSGSESTLFL